MKHIVFCAIPDSGAAQAHDRLHPADAYDISLAAKQALAERFTAVSTPVNQGASYAVTVTVASKTAASS